LDGCAAGGAHRVKFLGCGGHGRLDRGDLAQPALFGGFPEPVEEVGVDLLQPRDMSWVDSK
jgi:hypothetical protein